MKDTLYLAGPMTNIPQFNIPRFDQATADLRSRGYDIVSPAELDSAEVRAAALASATGAPEDVESIETWGDFLARDVKLIADECDGIVFLPNWQDSRGARLEAFVGLLCGREFMEYKGGILCKLHPLSVLSEISYVTDLQIKKALYGSRARYGT